MDLLKYLKPMKILPERFSNLAFWRGVKNFKDTVVDAFEYVDSWGKSVENTEVSLSNRINNIESKLGYPLLGNVIIPIDIGSVNCGVQQFGDNMIIMAMKPQTFSVELPDSINLNINSIGIAYLGIDVTYADSSGSVNGLVFFPIVLSKVQNLNNHCQVNMITGIGGLYANRAITAAPTTKGNAKLYIKRVKE